MSSDSIAHYELGAKIGEGGMGEVYRATDTKLHREVALKLLPAEFVQDHERLERFRREARALATLNHPNVGGIHGIEETDGRAALVLELIDGDTLQERIEAGGPLPLSDVSRFAEQIASALEAAHEQGIVHRDLKPANIKITPEDQIKVLDFGLAKATGAATASAAGVAESPTIMMTSAAHGMIMGTAPYMSPEQAKGTEVDQRADIWAYGAILFEMVSGERLFEGDDGTEVLAAVISREPDLSRLPDDLPGWLDDLIRRCLRRDLTMRLPHMASARIAVQEAGDETHERPAASTEPARGIGWAMTAAILTVGLLIGATGQRIWVGAEVDIPEVPTYGELVFDPPPVPEGAPVLSPDGRTLAYVGGDETNSRMVYLRSLDDGTTRALPGSHYAFEPIFSPDGQQLLFASAGRLLVARLGGGLPSAITAVAGTAEGSVWLPDDTIVYAALGTRFLQRVSVNGGTPEELRFEGVGDTTWTADPAPLPDPDKLLVSIQDSRGDSEPEIAVVSLSEGWLRRIARGSSPRFVPPHHLVFLQRNGLMVAPFDPDSLELTGPERAVTPAGGELISVRRTAGPTLLAAVSVDGTALFPMSLPEERRVVWVDQNGNEEDTGYSFAGGRTRTFSANGAASVSLSGDGRRIVVIEGETPVIVDLDAVDQRRVLPRVGTSTAYAGWVPGDEYVHVLSNRDGDFRSFRVLATGGRAAEPITRTPQSVLTSFLPGGQGALGYVIDQTRSRDLYEFDAQGEGSEILATTANERAPQISPDGQAFAYVSNELGEDRVYLRRYPDVGTAWPISGDFGSAPRWSADGSEIYYFEDNYMMAMAVDIGDQGVVTGPPRRLFSIGPYEEDPFGNTMYDVDDQGRFIMVRLGTGARTWRWVQNWSAQLEPGGTP